MRPLHYKGFPTVLQLYSWKQNRCWRIFCEFIPFKDMNGAMEAFKCKLMGID